MIFLKFLKNNSYRRLWEYPYYKECVSRLFDHFKALFKNVGGTTENRPNFAKEGGAHWTKIKISISKPLIG